MFSLQNKYHHLYKAMAVSVAVSFIIFQFVSYFSLHTHFLKDGTQIAHNHIVNTTDKDNNSEDHTHTKTELDCCYLASIFDKGLLSKVVVNIIVLLLFVSFIKESFLKQQFTYVHPLKVRGPPQPF